MSETMLTKILSAARELLCQHGPEGLTMEATADRAKVARKTVYNYFVNKYNLVHAVRLAWMQAVIEELTAIAEAQELQLIDKINIIVEKGFGYLKNAGRLLDKDNLMQAQIRTKDALRMHAQAFAAKQQAFSANRGQSNYSSSDPQTNIEKTVRESLFMLIRGIVAQAISAGFIIEGFDAERITWILINIIGGLLYLDVEENHFTKYDILRDSLTAVIRGILTPLGFQAMKESPILTGKGIT